MVGTLSPVSQALASSPSPRSATSELPQPLTRAASVCRRFDLGNHFNEYAGTEYDWSAVPDEASQKEFFQQYLAARDSATGRDGYEITRTVDETELEAMLVEVAVFSLASHLYWAVWAILQVRLGSAAGAVAPHFPRRLCVARAC